MAIYEEACAALLKALRSDRRESLRAIAEQLVLMGLPAASTDALLGAIIVEALEAQLIEEGGANPPPRDSTLDLFREVFTPPALKRDKN